MTEKRFIEQFEENVQKYPDKVILRDEHNSLTFRELDELSGRVYAYLREKGIGREDFVMLRLPHGILPYVAMIGVWKSGAAFVASAENLPIERERFIWEDCGCKLLIDYTTWTEVESTAAIVGFENTDVHDAAYAVYTSGSEGKPKGVLHEYGQLEYSAQVMPLNAELILPENSIEYVPLPVNFAGTILACTWLFWRRVCIDAGPIELMSDPLKLTRYFDEHHITIATLLPSYLNSHGVKSPYLKYVQISMEMANDVYSDEFKIVNSYAQSEGFIVCMFQLDRRYSITPIGRPLDMYHVELLEDDKPVKEGEMGEFCYATPYTRGYINLPEETAKAFRNGLYHTGDIARINEDGNYVILGRKSDMIKINGNRIEPAEIEAAVKRVLNIEWAFAKGFVEPERSFICVYYTADIHIDYAAVREALMSILPTYMIPSYFVHLDEIPHLPNGKVDRQALKAPDIEQYRAPYVAPENELEERICTEMEKVLAIGGNETRDEKPSGIGVNDDFYLLGGDSLRTIELVTNLDIEDLSVADIYAARTPRAITERWMQKQILVNCNSCDKN